MAITPTKYGNLTVVDFARFKAQALDTLLGSSDDASGADDIFGALPTTTSSLFEQYLGVSSPSSSSSASSVFGTSNVPSAADAFGGFYQPGVNVMTVLNRADVSYKAQFSELSELKSRIAQQADAARPLSKLDAQSSSADVLKAVKDFLDTYNAAVLRFAPDVDKGGILEGSAEAQRARFSLQRELADPLVGAAAGVRDGLSALGITVDGKTGLASLDEGKLNAALQTDKTAVTATLAHFSTHLIGTADSLNKNGNPQDAQLANLQKAIGWIADNRAAVEQEFGAGEAAKPNAAFAKAAAAYYALMSKT